MENTQNPFTPPQAGPKKSNKLKILIAILILAVIGGAWYFFVQSDLSIFQGKMGELSNDKESVKTEKKAAQNNPQSNQNDSSKSGINTCQTRVYNDQSCTICYDNNNVEVSRRCEYVGPPEPAPEPAIVITGSRLANTTIVGSLQEVAKFNIGANYSDQMIYIESITVVCADSYVTNSEFNDNPMEVWVNGERIFSDMENAADCSDTTVGSKGRIADFASPVAIAAGATVEFIFKYDTSAVAGQASGESLVFKIDGVAGQAPAVNDAVDWYYAEAEPTTASDSYPVFGPTLMY